MRHIVEPPRAAGACPAVINDTAQVRRQLRNPHAQRAHAGGQALGARVAVDLAVLPIAQAVHLVRQVLRDTVPRRGVARQRFAVALARREVVVVVVETGVEPGVVGRHARDAVQRGVQALRSVEVRLPRGIVRALDLVELGRGRGAGVTGFERIHARGLDE